MKRFITKFLIGIFLAIPRMLDPERKAKDRLIDVLIEGIEAGVSKNAPREHEIVGTSKQLVKDGLRFAANRAESKLNEKAIELLDKRLPAVIGKLRR